MGKVYSFALYKGENMMPEITIFKVAEYFLKMEPMTHKKLQKLCYYTQAWYLAFYKKRLFNSAFQAWVHGPVNPELYERYKNYGWNLISSTSSSTNNITDEFTINFLNSIYNTYCSFSGDQLETLSHSEMPWRSARADLDEWEPSQNLIDENNMKDFYWNIYEQNQRV